MGSDGRSAGVSKSGTDGGARTRSLASTRRPDFRAFGRMTECGAAVNLLCDRAAQHGLVDGRDSVGSTFALEPCEPTS